VVYTFPMKKFNVYVTDDTRTLTVIVEAIHLNYALRRALKLNPWATAAGKVI
jgi:hypothetical protein